MSEIVQTVVTALTSSGVMALVVALLGRKWARNDKKEDRETQENEKLDAVINGLKVLTVDRVRHLGQCYLDAHEITLEEKENLQDMYAAYKRLGGNGRLEVVINEVNRLPIVDKHKN